MAALPGEIGHEVNPVLSLTLFSQPVEEQKNARYERFHGLCRDGMVKLHSIDPTRMQSRPANPTTLQRLQGLSALLFITRIVRIPFSLLPKSARERALSLAFSPLPKKCPV